MRRIICAILVCCVTIAASAQTKPATFEEEVAAIKARGEPTDLADLRTTPPPDDQNAAIFTRRALAEFKLSNDQYWTLDNTFPSQYPLSPQDMQFVATVESKNQPVLDDLKKAMNAPKLDWHRPFDSGFSLSMSKEIDLSYIRYLHDLLWASALDAHAKHDDARAVLRLRESIFLGRALASFGSVMTLPCRREMEMVEKAAFVESELADDSATKEQIKHFIAELLDDQTQKDLLRVAFWTERVGFIDQSRTLLKMPAAPKAVWDADAVAVLHFFTRIADAGPDVPNMQVLESRMPAFPKTPWENNEAERKRHPMYMFLLSSNRITAEVLRARTLDHLLATALAIHLYKSDHNALPGSLDALVPAYLPLVPDDPMDAQNRPLRYAPERKLIYSVGEDGKDNGGTVQLLQGSPRKEFAWHPQDTARDGDDELFPLESEPWSEDLATLRSAEKAWESTTQP